MFKPHKWISQIGKSGFYFMNGQVIVQRGGWTDTQMISRVYGRHVTPVLQERADQLLQGFSVQNSRNIHEKAEEIRGASRRPG